MTVEPYNVLCEYNLQSRSLFQTGFHGISERALYHHAKQKFCCNLDTKINPKMKNEKDDLSRTCVKLGRNRTIWGDSWARHIYALNHRPGLHISCKDRKHRLENMCFKRSSYGLVSIW